MGSSSRPSRRHADETVESYFPLRHRALTSHFRGCRKCPFCSALSNWSLTPHRRLRIELKSNVSSPPHFTFSLKTSSLKPDTIPLTPSYFPHFPLTPHLFSNLTPFLSRTPHFSPYFYSVKQLTLISSHSNWLPCQHTPTLPFHPSRTAQGARPEQTYHLHKMRDCPSPNLQRRKAQRSV